MQRPPHHPGETYTSVYRVEDPELGELLGSLPHTQWVRLRVKLERPFAKAPMLIVAAEAVETP